MPHLLLLPLLCVVLFATTGALAGLDYVRFRHRLVLLTLRFQYVSVGSCCTTGGTLCIAQKVWLNDSVCTATDAFNRSSMPFA